MIIHVNQPTPTEFVQIKKKNFTLFLSLPTLHEAKSNNKIIFRAQFT